MSGIFDSVMNQLTSGDALSAIGQKAGADEESVKSTLNMGLPMLLGAMNKSASKPEGMNAIMSGLSQTTGADPMSSITGLLGSSGSSAFGSDMLSSILGGGLDPIQQLISKKVGLPSGVVGKILSMALPFLMGSLTKKLGSNMTSGDISKLLGEQSKMALSASPDASDAMQDLLVSEKSSGGIVDRIKKFFSSGD